MTEHQIKPNNDHTLLPLHNIGLVRLSSLAGPLLYFNTLSDCVLRLLLGLRRLSSPILNLESAGMSSSTFASPLLFTFSQLTKTSIIFTLDNQLKIREHVAFDF